MDSASELPTESFAAMSLSEVNLVDNLFIRRLQVGDFEKKFIQCLSELTTTGDIDYPEWEKRFKELDESPDYTILVVVDNDKDGEVIGSATLLIERKFVHHCGKVGHIEDVVVSSDYRGKRLGLYLIQHLCAAARDSGCYKVILDCAEHNVNFYERCGFRVKEKQMRFDC